METLYELWDIPSQNLLWAYTSIDEACVAVREFIEDDGAEAANGLALIRHEPDGSGGVIAVDAELAALALRDAPDRAIAD